MNVHVERLLKSLRAHASRKRFSGAALARAVDLDSSTINRTLSGDTALDVERLFEILEAMNVEPWRFFRETFPPPELPDADARFAVIEERLDQLEEAQLNVPMTAEEERRLVRKATSKKKGQGPKSAGTPPRARTR